jgi:hypothetical protein
MKGLMPTHVMEMFLIRSLLFIQASGFIAAALVHSGVVLPGHEHVQARLAEGSIALILLMGFAATMVRPARSREIGSVAQKLALVGMLIGVIGMSSGIDPGSVLPNAAFHAWSAVVLVLGLVLTRGAVE